MALLGPSSRKRKRTGTGTSSTASSSTASRSRTKAMVGRERNSTQPGGVRPLWASAGRTAPPSPQPRGGTEAGQPPGPPPPGFTPHTHEDHCSLGVLGDLLQQLQLVLGLGARDAGRWHWRWQLALGVQNGAQAGPLAALRPAVLAGGDPSQAGPPAPLTSRSTSSRVSGTPPMRGSVTWGSLSAP